MKQHYFVIMFFCLFFISYIECIKKLEAVRHGATKKLKAKAKAKPKAKSNKAAKSKEKASSAKKKAPAGTGKSTNSTKLADLYQKDEPNYPPIPTIKFGPAANKIQTGLNSVGEKVKKNVVLNQFPYKITRCDQIVVFACGFINDDNDYRVRKSAYMAITAHFSNLYADKDGQKLIQQVIHTQMKELPMQISGARGCVRIGGDKGQKPMLICTASRANAENLLEVYKDFTRCRLGDNLTPIPNKDLEMLLSLCNMDKSKLMASDLHKRQHLRVQAGAINNSKKVLVKKVTRKQLMMMNRNKKHKKKLPQFEFPPEENNKWEHDRLNYFMPTPLRVPGSKIEKKLPPGIVPGLNPINNPGTAPQSVHSQI